MRRGTTPTRRRFIQALTVGAAAFAGCLGSSRASVTETRFAHQDGEVGVFVGLQDNDPNEASPVMVKATILDEEEEVIAEREEEFDLGGNSEGNVIVWFEDLTDEDQDQAEIARAEVVD